ncbi:metal-dependent hydrolase [Nocardia carnea]|uniref:metal-dependent hydrolase n=1 Tax=Nocardia carnea TaxID=37328 RepID=UPI0024578413|nr:metal-dependent hydrolase [Nocardia carnea]
MLGHSHATSGALAFATAATVVPVPVMEFVRGPVDVSALELILGALITAGAALLPDIDHPGGTIGDSLGPLSNAVAKGVATVSGGHRKGTHGLLFVLLAGWATWAGVNYLGRYFTLGVIFVMLAFGIRALHLTPRGDSFRAWGLCVLLAGGGTVLMDRWLPDSPYWLPFAIGLGALIHIVGDCLTDRGCPLLWPLKPRLAVPIISRTGNKVETWVLTPAMGLVTIALFYLYAVPQ